MCLADVAIARSSVNRVTAGTGTITLAPDSKRIALIVATDNTGAVLNVYAAASADASRLVGGRNTAGDQLQVVYHERDWGMLIQGPFTIVPVGTPNIAVWEIIASADLAAVIAKVGLG